MKQKKIISAVAALLTAAAALVQGTPAIAVDSVPLERFTVCFYPLPCGKQIQNGVYSETEGSCEAVDANGADIYEPASDIEILVQRADGTGKPVPFDGTIEGGMEYQGVYTAKLTDQYVFTADTEFTFSDEDTVFEVLSQDAHSVKFAFTQTAVHEPDYETEQTVRETCRTDGSRVYSCMGCGREFTEILPADPDSHAWSAWEITEAPTAFKRGKAVRTCQECGEVGNYDLPMLYSTVYEPQTSVSMAATVAWRADATALQTAGEEIRPATMFVWVDAGLKVYDRDGRQLAESVAEFVEKTASTVIPAFYIRDEETAAALKAWLEESQFEDCFVVSTPENKAFVKDAADLLHVRGMLDFTANKTPDRKALTDMIADVNGAHGKVVLLSAQAATRENIKLLQSLAATVWVQTPTDTKTVVTMYTNGVDGVLVDDYKAAIRAEELFHDDAPSLLRTPLIIGHRGDPSNYPENTLASAKGAFEEGADSIENDIHLSKDGEVFIRHDEDMGCFFGKPEVKAADMTLAELKAIPFIWEKIRDQNEVVSDDKAYGSKFGGKLCGEEEGVEYFIPTFREYLEEFKGRDVVHDTELKTADPAIVPAFKALVDEYDAWDQVFTISFNENLWELIYKDYPEISIGALMFYPMGKTFYEGGTYEEIAEKNTPEIALEYLYSTLDRWNVTYNPSYMGYGTAAVRAGRHRGLTVWPWTYSTTFGQKELIRDYLAGVRGMTVDEPWFASDLITQIASEDVYLETSEELQTLAKPVGTTQAGEQRVLEEAEPVMLEQNGNELLMIWRFPAELRIGEKTPEEEAAGGETPDVEKPAEEAPAGEKTDEEKPAEEASAGEKTDEEKPAETFTGKYYLYSNPFVVTLGDMESAEETQAAEAAEDGQEQGGDAAGDNDNSAGGGGNTAKAATTAAKATTVAATPMTVAGVSTMANGKSAKTDEQPGTGDALAGALVVTTALLAVSGAIAFGTRNQKKDEE